MQRKTIATAIDNAPTRATEKSSGPLIAIVGETASGKSDLALDLAERFNGEIICADSRTVYAGMDVGTAKPSQEDRGRITHHLLDIARPDENFNVASFQKLALETIQTINERGKLPILVGGTGLYIDSVLYGFSLNTPGDTGRRTELDAMSTESLQSIIKSRGIKMPVNSNNRRHLIRAIETDGKQPTRNLLRANTCVVGLRVPKDILDERIAERVDVMFRSGLEEEVRSLANQYGWDAEAMSAVGYREWKEYFMGQQSLESTKQLIITHTRQYAKRQRTWFNRSKHIYWTDTKDAAQEIVMKFLQQNK